MQIDEMILSGWGRTAPSRATVVDADEGEVAGRAALDGIERNRRGIIARGLGRAYGDPAQNAGGTVLRLTSGGDAITLDAATGTVTAAGGVSFDDLLRHIVPRGWFVPVTPGTRFVTVGGAIASDIHGKNHHADRSFGCHVTTMRLLMADGSISDLTPASDPELWFATVGGMGLTGIVLEATFRLLPIETSRCLVDTERLPDLDALLSTLTSDDAHRYSVAWIDLLARGADLGRSVLTRAEHATVEDLAEHAPRASADPLAFAPPALVDVPMGLPNLLPRPAVLAFNEIWYRKAPRQHRGVEGITSFFHPLDMLGRWNRLYGRPGFLQYQFVVPFEATSILREIVERVASAGRASIIAVLKRLGDPSGGMLSFPQPGWTLTCDFGAGVDGLAPLLRTLDQLVLDAGGRHYLAKDAHTTPEVIRAGYPRLDEWKAARRRVDPDRRWVSDQARRLDLL